MNFTNRKEIAELVGIAAIALSLIFVGLETRNGTIQAELNTRALELAAYQQLIENISHMNTLNIENPDVAVARAKAGSVPAELSDRERSLVGSWIFLRLRHGDMAYFQYERGSIDELRLQSAMSPLFQLLNMQYARDFWERRQDNFVPSYRTYVNEQLAIKDGAQSN